ncbi:MAG: PAS domain S-box protein [Vicinamibacteria bacterium]|nr:PAS domain S-box protein [Vicinamibacteria bacterium]
MARKGETLKPKNPNQTGAAASERREDDLRATVARMQRQQEAISQASLSDAFVAGDVDRFAREFTEMAAATVEVERASIWLFNEDETELRCIDLFEASLSRHSSGAVLREMEYMAEFAALKRARFVDADTPLIDARTAGYVEGYLKPLRITSMLDAVVEASGQCLGVLCLEHVDRPHHWERDEVAFACQLADKVALALVNRARRQAQDTLRTSELRYRRLFETAKDGILVLDGEGGAILDVNPFMAGLVGCERSDLLGRRVWELGFFEEVLHDEAHFMELSGNDYIRYECLGLRPRHGRRVEVEFISSAYLVNQKKVIHCNVRDITDRKLVEGQLRKLSRIVEQSPVSIAITDLAGALEYVNPTFTEVTGYSREEVLGKNPRILQSGETPVEIYREMWQALVAGNVWRGEFRNRKKNGEIYVELAVVAPVVGPDGRATHYVAVKEDITERKRADEELEASLREKQALLREVHHRVKNNLQVITSLLRLEAARSEGGASLRVLKDMQGRILSMALLHETLYRSGEFGRVELESYVRQLSQQLFRAHGSETMGASLVLDLSPVRVDIDQAIPCGLLVSEMLTNSLKHAFAGGRTGEVRVVVRPAGEKVQVEVSDDGAGLPPDFEDRRAKSLGMQLITDLARQLGGQLEIGPGPGAQFKVAFSRTRLHSTGPTLRPAT